MRLEVTAVRHGRWCSFLEETDTCFPMDVKRQTEQECGVRMMTYMMMYRECVDRKTAAQNTIRQLKRATTAENKRTYDLAKASSKKVSKFLKQQRENALK